MTQRFEQAYKVKRRDNLGDPEFWNTRFQDIDLRIAARELDGDRIANAVDELTNVALQRLNDTFTPVVDEAIERLQSVGALFSSSSDTTETIDVSPKTFLLNSDDRAGFVVTDYVAIRPNAFLDRGMICQVTSYDRATGLLDVTPVLFTGAGTYSDWLVRVTGAPDLDHATRTDNPHETTAGQVGAYTTAQVDAIIAGLGLANISGLVAALAAKAPTANPTFTGAPIVPTASIGTSTTQAASTAFVANAMNALVASAPGTLDTLAELAAALNNDPNFATTTLAARIGSTIWTNQSSAPAGTLVEDGASYSSTAYAALFNVLVRSATVTLTIASPGLINWAGNKLKLNDPVKLTTTGALATGLTAGTTVYVKSTGNAFQVSATPGGPAINFTGAQSGAHKAINAPHGCANDLSTFNVPNTLGNFIRAWDGGRGVDSNRVFGSEQLDAFQGWKVSVTAIVFPNDWALSNVAGSNGYGPLGSNSQSTGLPSSDGTNGTPRTAAETRPRNSAKLPCIIYQ